MVKWTAHRFSAITIDQGNEHNIATVKVDGRAVGPTEMEVLKSSKHQLKEKEVRFKTSRGGQTCTKGI